jgi:hypothetical protein
MTWMTKDPIKWTTKDYKNFITEQNTYSYDGNRPIKHSAQSLARFCCLNAEQTTKLTKVYNQLYNTETVN